VWVWIVLLNRVLSPVSKLTKLISDGAVFTKGSNSDIEEDDFPLELKRIYSKFSNVYSKMAQQNQFSQVLVGAIGDIIITVNKEGHICYANPAARQWFGVCETLLIGQPLELFTSNIGSEGPDVATWLYKSNVDGERVKCSGSLVNLICKEYVYLADIIVQPVDLVKDEQNSSSSVIVIRLRDKITVSEFFH
ncbi:hypothetical protein L4C33_17245, partial [Vibrio makurazakiensis]|uniref:hypothetical protein n=1 Tax=Vibrio makurazakiensis TaxID=2910250 RepID=UPI003D14AED1